MKAKIFAVSALLVLLLCSCSEKLVEQTLYLGDATIDGPITLPPTHVSINRKAGDITISPKFSVNTTKQILAQTKDNYRDAVGLPDKTIYQANNKNLKWNTSQIVAGIDFDIAAASMFGVFGGIHFAGSENKDLFGGNFGLGLFSQSKNISARFDFGFSFQNYGYDVATIVKTRTSSEGKTTDEFSIYRDKGENKNINPFLSFTLNSLNEDSPLNYFCSLGYFTQKLINFQPREPLFGYLTWVHTTDLRSETTCGFVMFGPGFSYDFNDKMRFVFSAKILKEVLTLDKYNDWIIIPSVQLDFHL